MSRRFTCEFCQNGRRQPYFDTRFALSAHYKHCREKRAFEATERESTTTTTTTTTTTKKSRHQVDNVENEQVCMMISSTHAYHAGDNHNNDNDNHHQEEYNGGNDDNQYDDGGGYNDGSNDGAGDDHGPRDAGDGNQQQERPRQEEQEDRGEGGGVQADILGHNFDMFPPSEVIMNIQSKLQDEYFNAWKQGQGNFSIRTSKRMYENGGEILNHQSFIFSARLFNNFI